MQRAFDTLWPLLLAFLLQSKPAPAAPALPSRSSQEVQRVRTGEPDVMTWFQLRFARALQALAELGVPDIVLRAVGLSLVSQWAHETGRGKSEFNFNLGGWRARSSDPFFVARDVQSGAELFRWTAYPDLDTAVRDQVKRLHDRFPSAFRLLLAEPNTSAWVEELGRKGYYTAKPADYARAWAMNRAELGALAP